MAIPLSCYFLDEPLTAEETRLLQQALLGPWAKFKTGAVSLVEKRVPLVLPTPNPDGGYASAPEQRAEGIRRNLRHAGIRADLGRQVVWIMPQDEQWDAVFQYAIREETGLAPYVVQRWYREEGKLMRGAPRVVDTQMLIEGLE